MNRKRHWLVMLGLLALSSPTVADESVGPRAGKVYLTPGMAIYRAPNGDDLRGGPAIGIGYMVNPNFGLELLYSDVKVDRDGVVASRQDASRGKGRDAELFWANALYKVGGTGKFQPFTLFGVGRTEIGGSSETEINVGAGSSPSSAAGCRCAPTCAPCMRPTRAASSPSLSLA